jgi:hypothetical protein
MISGKFRTRRAVAWSALRRAPNSSPVLSFWRRQSRWSSSHHSFAGYVECISESWLSNKSFPHCIQLEFSHSLSRSISQEMLIAQLGNSWLFYSSLNILSPFKRLPPTNSYWKFYFARSHAYSLKLGRSPGFKTRHTPLWSTSRVLLLAALTGISTYTFAMQWPLSKSRDYSRIDKFSTPQYASIQDMEAVSAHVHNCKSSFTQSSLGAGRNPRSNFRRYNQH